MSRQIGEFNTQTASTTHRGPNIGRKPDQTAGNTSIDSTLPKTDGTRTRVMGHLGVQEGITDYATANYYAAGATAAARPPNARVLDFAGHYLQLAARRIQHERCRPRVFPRIRPVFLLSHGGGRRYRYGGPFKLPVNRSSRSRGARNTVRGTVKTVNRSLCEGFLAGDDARFYLGMA